MIKFSDYGSSCLNKNASSVSFKYVYRLQTISVFLLVIMSLFVTPLFGQDENDSKNGVITCSDFNITRPLKEIFAERPVNEKKIYRKHEQEDRKHREPQKYEFTGVDGPQYGNDPKAVQTKMGEVQNRAPITNWAGQNPGNFRPFDPSGAPGPNDYVQMTNSTVFKVYDKVSGAVSLTANLGSLWTPSTPDDGDPIVLYDKTADRWFLAQFGSNGNKIYIAISTSGDPTGSYYTYTFTSPEFPDYLKFSVWQDGYYMTSNQTQKVFAFDRLAMLAGDPTSRAIYTSFSPPETNGFFVPITGDASDGVMPPSGSPCPIFSYSDNGWGSGFSDAVNIYQMSVNWAPSTPTATITLAANVPTAAFDGSYDQNWDDIVQPGTSQKLDGIGGICMFRAQWKSFGGYNTVLLNWGVKINSNQRSIKWCELRQDPISLLWSMYQEGIYTPDAATRWMGSIAMDNNGSIGLCYMKSDATSIYPGLYYAGRRSCDPPGTLPIAEEIVVPGTVSQTGTNRNGDYASLTLDPDGITFWHTSEYMGGSTGGNAARTRIFSFQLPNCANIASVSILQTAGTNPLCPGETATFTATPFNGGTATYQWQVDGLNVGTNNPVFTSSTLTNGQVVSCIMTSSLGGVSGSPATSNTITITVNPVVTPSVTIALTTGTNPTCDGTPVIFTATPSNGGSIPVYQWMVNGANAGTNSPTFMTAALMDGQQVSCTITSNAYCTTTPNATSNDITMTVNPVLTPVVTIAQTGGATPLCPGESATFTATVNNGTAQSYQWKIDGVNAGTDSAGFTSLSLTNGQMVSCEVTANSACSSLHIDTLGTGTSLNSSSSSSANSGAAYPTYYGNGRQQYLVRASELIALGFTAGNVTSIGFKVAGTTGNPATLNGYTIKMGMTAATVTSTTFLTPAFTTVFGPVNYTPVINSVNTHLFSTPFIWDGTSNVVIDICFSNLVSGSIAYQNYRTTTSFNSTTYYQADGVGGANACSTPTTTHASTRRPNMVFAIGAGTPIVASNTITMNVYPTVVSLTINQNGDSLITSQGYNSYQWYEDLTLISGANNYFYLAMHSGNYSVMISDSNGCMASAQISNVIASVNDLSNKFNNFTVEYFGGEFHLHINSSVALSSVIRITDALGKIVGIENVSLEKGKNDLDLNGYKLSEGVYFISLMNSGQSVSRKVFVGDN